MELQRQQRTRDLAAQVAEIAGAAVQERVERRRLSEERAEQTAAVDRWLSRERAVLVAVVVTLPILITMILVNVMDLSPLEWITPSPEPQVARRLAQEALDTVVKGVDAYQHDYSTLPPSLVEIGTPAQGDWDYTSDGGNFTVTVKMFHQQLRFDSRSRPQATSNEDSHDETKQ